MTRARRKFSAFSLSFLDIMSCGFGAVVLLFLIIKHNVDAAIPASADSPDLSSEVSLLNKEILTGQERLAELRRVIAEIDQQIAASQQLAVRVARQISETVEQTGALTPDSQNSKIESLKKKIIQTEQEIRQLQKEAISSGEGSRVFVGKGDREYVSGLKLGGDRILVLLDSSASMLADTIVNIIRRRNMTDQSKRKAKKWRQAIRIVDWLSARFPAGSQYQIYTFNTDVTAVKQGSKGRWLKVGNKQELNATINNLSGIIPANGTSLENAFLGASGLRPLPDNIFLITDSLPTQGRTASRKTIVTGDQRLKFFKEALKQLPAGVPVNVILSPMEGDPIAASSFWKLAQTTQGSFLSPSEDWP